MKMSEICRKAANEHLWDGVGFYWEKASTPYCCFAIENAVPDFDGERKAKKFLRATVTPFSGAFENVRHGKKRQAARFMLLHFAALYFEDLGE
jgi:hypothetical protein